ncbi:MAG: hypothetical protein ACO3SP_08440, partial [Ilumatobacteraceae bacterium]
MSPSSRTRPDLVPDGLQYHRQRVLQFAPLMSLTVPMISGILALVLLRGSTSTWRGLIGFVAAVVALPTAPIVGLPVVGGSGRWVAALLSSLALWCLLGIVAARRAPPRLEPDPAPLTAPGPRGEQHLGKHVEQD